MQDSFNVIDWHYFYFAYDNKRVRLSWSYFSLAVRMETSASSSHDSHKGVKYPGLSLPLHGMSSIPYLPCPFPDPDAFSSRFSDAIYLACFLILLLFFHRELNIMLWHNIHNTKFSPNLLFNGVNSNTGYHNTGKSRRTEKRILCTRIYVF